MKTATAIRKAGSKLALARLLGITRQSIQNWGDEVPAKRQLVLDEHYGKKTEAKKARK